VRRPGPAHAPECEPADLAEALEGGAPLVDVRMPEEYEELRVPGATLIPLPELAQRAQEVPRDRPVYVICATGNRSLLAAQALNNAGWTAVSVTGGTKAWAEEGRPVETGPEG
jgi:rhodanese-related sulfurtransferase